MNVPLPSFSGVPRRPPAAEAAAWLARLDRGLTPADLIDIAALNGLYFHAGQQEGVTFHLIGALSEFGKLGVVAIGADPARADALYRRTVAALDRETA